MPTLPASVRPVLLVLLLWMAGLGAAVQFAKIGVPFAQVRALYPQAGAELGLLLSLLSLVGIVFGMTAGVLVARLGFRRLLIAGLLLGAVVSLAQASLPGFTLMLVSRLIEGISHLIIVVAAPTLIAQIAAGPYRGMAMTLWSSFFGVAFAIIGWFGLPFVESYGLRGLFLAHGAFMFGVAVLLSLGLSPSNAAVSVPLGIRMVLRRHLDAYRSPFISAPAMGWLFYTVTFVSLLTILPDILPRESRSLAASLMPLASIVVALVGVSALLSIMAATRIIILGFVLSSAVLLLFWAGVQVVPLSIALFATLGLVQGASFAAVPQLNPRPDAQALANGAVAQMGNLGNTLGTPILLIILARFGLQGVIIAALLCYLAGIAVHLWFARRRSAGHRQQFL